MAYTTFVLGITMFKNLPRQTFGKLQAKLFPKYFLLSTITIMLQVSVLSLVSVKGLNVLVLLVLLPADACDMDKDCDGTTFSEESSRRLSSPPSLSGVALG